MKRQKDINCAGGAIRPIMKRHRGQYDAGYELLDMSTGKPHTNQSLKAALEVRKNEYPEMTQMIEAVLAGELTKRRNTIRRLYINCRVVQRPKRLPGRVRKKCYSPAQRQSRGYCIAHSGSPIWRLAA